MDQTARLAYLCAASVHKTGARGLRQLARKSFVGLGKLEVASASVFGVPAARSAGLTTLTSNSFTLILKHPDMAMSELVASRTSYLQEAAHLLAVSSPAASAFLGSARNRLIEASELEVPAKEWDALRRETCGACGNLLIPGWSCEVSSKPQTHQKGHQAKSKAHAAGAPSSTAYHCTRCRRRSEQTLQPKARRQLKRSKTPAATQPITTGIRMNLDDNKPPKTANASSKQRQKTRKGGLQAMLEKSKTQSSNQGLDLMDFLM